MDPGLAIRDAIRQAFVDVDGHNITDAVFALARAIDRLGNADAATPMGGLEALGAVLKEALDGLAEATSSVAQATREE